MFTKPAGSHIPVLVEVLRHTDKPVLELGSGWYSTPILSWLCESRGIPFESYENDFSWVKILDGMSLMIDDYANAPIDREWGMVFIDHAPAERRIVDIERLKDLADYIVVHDTEPEEVWRYSYDKIFGMFKYRYDYTKATPHTTVFSNKKELNFNL